MSCSYALHHLAHEKAIVICFIFVKYVHYVFSRNADKHVKRSHVTTLLVMTRFHTQPWVIVSQLVSQYKLKPSKPITMCSYYRWHFTKYGGALNACLMTHVCNEIITGVCYLLLLWKPCGKQVYDYSVMWYITIVWTNYTVLSNGRSIFVSVWCRDTNGH